MSDAFPISERFFQRLRVIRSVYEALRRTPSSPVGDRREAAGTFRRSFDNLWVAPGAFKIIGFPKGNHRFSNIAVLGNFMTCDNVFDSLGGLFWGVGRDVGNICRSLEDDDDCFWIEISSI